MKFGTITIAGTVVCLSGLISAGPAMGKEATDLYSISIDVDSERLSASTPNKPNLSFGPNSRPWLPRILSVLKKRRPPSFELTLAAVVANNSNDEYVLVEWSCKECYRSTRLEIHKVFDKPGATKGVEFLREWVGEYDSFTDQTGLSLTPGRAPLIVVREASGGSGAEGYRLRLLEARRNTVDIVPPGSGRVLAVRDLDNDGRLEVLSIDSRWTGAFDTRGVAGPHIPIVLSRTDGGFRPVCSSHPQLYKQLIANLEKYLRESKKITGSFYFEVVAEIALVAAQAGFFDMAAKYASMLDGEKDLYERWFSAEYADAYKRTGKAISGFIAAIKKDWNPGCFVSTSAGQGQHTGAGERIESSR